MAPLPRLLIQEDQGKAQESVVSKKFSCLIRDLLHCGYTDVGYSICCGGAGGRAVGEYGQLLRKLTFDLDGEE